MQTPVMGPKAHCLTQPEAQSLPWTKTGPCGHSSVWEVSYQMFEGGKKIPLS